MFRRKGLNAALLGVLAVLGCSESVDDARPVAEEEPATTRQHTAAADEAPPEAVELESLIERFLEAAESGEIEEIERAEEALVALGPDAVARLVALVDDDTGYAADEIVDLIVGFGEAAIPALCDRVRRDEGEFERWTIDALWKLEPIWSRGPHLIDVVDAAIVRFEAYDSELPVEARERARDRAEQAVVLLSISLGPGGEPAAEALAKLWSRAHVDDHDLRSEAYWTLVTFGSGAGPAAPIVMAGFDHYDEDERYVALQIVSAAGSAAAEVLPQLRELLRSEDASVRAGVADALRGWGSAGAPADPELFDLLDDEIPRVCAAAARALARRHPTDERVRLRLLVAAADQPARISGPPITGADDIISAIIRDVRVARDWIAAIPRLQEEHALSLVGNYEWPEQLGDELVRSALASQWPDVRSDGLRAWKGVREDAVYDNPSAVLPAVPEHILALLDDPHDRVRAQAARALATEGGDAAERARVVAESLRDHADESVRNEALRALGEGPVWAGSGVAPLVRGLNSSDAATRHASASMLVLTGLLDGPLDGVTPETVTWLANNLLEADVYAAVLVRSPGGVDAYLRAMREAVSGEVEEARRVMAAIAGGGRHAVALRPEVEAATLRNDADGARGRWFRGRYEELIIAFERDAMAVARTANAREPHVAMTRLLEITPVRSDALLLYAGRIDESLSPVLSCVGEEPSNEPEVWELIPADVAAELRSAAIEAMTAEDDDAGLRQLGAARLAPALDDATAVRLLVALADDVIEDIRRAALTSLRAVESRAPGSVPVDVVERALRDGATRSPALGLARLFDGRGASLVPTLEEISSSEWDPHRVAAATLAWRIDGNLERAEAVIRDVLADNQRVLLPERFWVERVFHETDEISWADVADVLRAGDADAGDVDLIVGVIPPGDPAQLLPVLERFGANAAPAIPLLRRFLSTRDVMFGYVHADGEAAARALGHMGPAAEAALPDLRLWVARTGDVNGVGSAAIRAIEGGD